MFPQLQREKFFITILIIEIKILRNYATILKYEKSLRITKKINARREKINYKLHLYYMFRP
jgi:hypothetical protein